MQVKVTVSRSGGKVGNSFAQSITFKDVATIEELINGVSKEFGALFPKYAALVATPDKREEKKRGK